MELKYYIMRRILVLIPTLMGLTLLVYLLFNLVPEYMITAGLVSPHFQGAQRLAAIKLAKVVYGLTYANGQPIPIYIRYFLYLKDLLTGNWGFMTSNMFTGNVLTGIELYFPNTLQLTIFAVIVTFLVSIPLGTYIGSRPNSGADQVGRIFSLTGYAMPAFFLADALVIVFGRYLPIVGSISPLSNPPAWAFSSSGSYLISSPTHMFVFDGIIHFLASGNIYDLQIAENAFLHLILPVATLTYGLLAGVLRYIRAGMVDSMNQEYVKTARSKGVSEKDVIKKHIRKNALIPTVTVMGLLFASLLGGVVVVETVFLYPGIGLFAVNAALGGTAGQLQPQIYGVLGVTLVFGVILMLANLVVDVVYALIDPRIRY